MSKLTRAVGDRDHVQGAPSATVTLVEYGDYECPYCGQAYPIVQAIQRKLGASLRFVFRNFPLREMHPHAELAAEAAEAAGAQGRFWEMHDLLYENQERLDGPSLLRYAEGVVADPKKWIEDMNVQAFARRVQEDFMSGVRSGVNGTPSFFIDGTRHDASFDEETLLRALEARLGPRQSTAY